MSGTNASELETNRPPPKPNPIRHLWRLGSHWAFVLGARNTVINPWFLVYRVWRAFKCKLHGNPLAAATAASRRPPRPPRPPRPHERMTGGFRLRTYSAQRSSISSSGKRALILRTSPVIGSVLLLSNQSSIAALS